ncbi:hypothetical protein HJG54_17860 [Leptolyngbya sp. NK1-12]|uniref:Uncharacterized protein n=1 Tax=Leptolyngbya sp. NK1-12 TaxID=2547451 RepID=A0AA96WFN8_9CYAN|nr:hypothetical protein [Leptolyngbya sp. NK1-12]WNZ24533.1 hypothetical protein HJG54_17860 [Leptolyngbya sp. NK1-12]
MAKRIKLGMDWFSWPVWNVDDSGDVNPNKLPISQKLMSDLIAWQKAYNANFNRDCPHESDFPSEKAANSWYKEGIMLWMRMVDELSPYLEYEVFYPFDYQGKKQLFKHPNELPGELRTKWLNDNNTDSQS